MHQGAVIPIFFTAILLVSFCFVYSSCRWSSFRWLPCSGEAVGLDTFFKPNFCGSPNTYDCFHFELGLKRVTHTPKESLPWRDSNPCLWMQARRSSTELSCYDQSWMRLGWGPSWSTFIHLYDYMNRWLLASYTDITTHRHIIIRLCIQLKTEVSILFSFECMLQVTHRSRI